MLLELRKEENDLRIIGIGVIVFGLWNAAKAFLFEFLPNTQRAVVRADILEENVPVSHRHASQAEDRAIGDGGEQRGKGRFPVSCHHTCDDDSLHDRRHQ